MANIGFATSVKTALKGAKSVVLLAPAAAVERKSYPNLLGDAHDELVLELAKGLSPGDCGACASSLCSNEPRKLVVGVLPDRVSRYNAPARAEAIRRTMAAAAGHLSKGKVAVIIVLDDVEHTAAAVNAVGRAFPLLSMKSVKGMPRRLQIAAVDRKGGSLDISSMAKSVLEWSREAARWVDTPPSELNPGAFAEQIIKGLKGKSGVKVREIVGEKLVAEQLGGIYAVGKAAVSAPRMVVATYTPSKRTKKSRHVALVGKGVTFDTGGLHLKPRGGIEGMKCDMGGAAAVVGAFRVLVERGCPHTVTLIVCLAENAIDSASYKPDDVITTHSGKTVEINNTDAEGRLLLVDGVSYAARELEVDCVIDAATLTGAQMIATGQAHAAVFSNDEELESLAVVSGKKTGDLVHPLIFAPELFRQEFASPIADMTNSVQNRFNAQSSCAAQFIYAHLEGTSVKWLHIDLAGPSFIRGRGTGFGVALISEMVRALPKA